MARIVTIGVYEFDLLAFLRALRAADVGLLVDVRQRHGVRGSRYAWASARRLQAALAEAGKPCSCLLTGPYGYRVTMSVPFIPWCRVQT